MGTAVGGEGLARRTRFGATANVPSASPSHQRRRPKASDVADGDAAFAQSVRLGSFCKTEARLGLTLSGDAQASESDLGFPRGLALLSVILGCDLARGVFQSRDALPLEKAIPPVTAVTSSVSSVAPDQTEAFHTHAGDILVPFPSTQALSPPCDGREALRKGPLPLGVWASRTKAGASLPAPVRPLRHQTRVLGCSCTAFSVRLSLFRSWDCPHGVVVTERWPLPGPGTQCRLCHFPSR